MKPKKIAALGIGIFAALWVAFYVFWRVSDTGIPTQLQESLHQLNELRGEVRWRVAGVRKLTAQDQQSLKSIEAEYNDTATEVNALIDSIQLGLLESNFSVAEVKSQSSIARAEALRKTVNNLLFPPPKLGPAAESKLPLAVIGAAASEAIGDIVSGIVSGGLDGMAKAVEAIKHSRDAHAKAVSDALDLYRWTLLDAS